MARAGIVVDRTRGVVAGSSTETTPPAIRVLVVDDVKLLPEGVARLLSDRCRAGELDVRVRRQVDETSQ